MHLAQVYVTAYNVYSPVYRLIRRHFCFVSSWMFCFFASFIALVSIMSICPGYESRIVVTCPSIPVARFAFCLCFIRFVLLFVVVLSGEPKQNQGRGLVDRKLVQAPPPSPVILLLAVPRRLFCSGSSVVLDVECRYFTLFLLYINIEIGKNIC